MSTGMYLSLRKICPKILLLLGVPFIATVFENEFFIDDNLSGSIVSYVKLTDNDSSVSSLWFSRYNAIILDPIFFR